MKRALTTAEVERDYVSHLAMGAAAVLDDAVSTTDARFTLFPYVYPENAITEPYLGKVTVNWEALKEQDDRVVGPRNLIPRRATTWKGRSHSPRPRARYC
ncbi:MAG: hypothetical protein GY903_22975 [Fuerstiella sp.]|nr:hypothetical protein [Fuerstiella sp.]MCP4857357.1 hypothetical protein [Fuerstiella sp.]